MALRSLLGKSPALGIRSLAGTPVHAPSPAAAYRRMSSHARTRYVDSCPRVNQQLETIDRLHAENMKTHRDMMAMIRSDLDKWDMASKALCCPINAFSAFVLFRHLFG